MKKPLKATINFFKKRSVQLWAIIMVGVTVVGFGVLSAVMLTNRTTFTQLEFTQRVITDHATNTFIDQLVEFDFVPKLTHIDTITISNNNEDLSFNPTLNNNKAGGEFDSVSFANHGRIVSNVMDRIDSGRKTNAFTQFFTGGEGNRNDDGRVNVTPHVGSVMFDDLSDGVWIRLVFHTPQFVINNNALDGTGGLHWRIEEFNENYRRPRDEEHRAVMGSLTEGQYNNNVVNAIHIPLGNVRNRVTEQVWYLSTGTSTISNPTSIGFTFSTFGNYYNLLRYVRDIDDDYLL